MGVPCCRMSVAPGRKWVTRGRRWVADGSQAVARLSHRVAAMSRRCRGVSRDCRQSVAVCRGGVAELAVVSRLSRRCFLTVTNIMTEWGGIFFADFTEQVGAMGPLLARATSRLEGSRDCSNDQILLVKSPQNMQQLAMCA